MLAWPSRGSTLLLAWLVAGTAVLSGIPAAASTDAGAAPNRLLAGARPSTGHAAGSDDVARPPQDLPGSYEVIPRAAALSSEAASARQTIADLADLSPLARAVEEARERRTRLRRRLAEITDEAYPRVGRVSEVRDRAAEEKAALEELAEQVSERARRLVEIRRRWEEERDFWRHWRSAVEGTPEAAAVRGEMDDSLTSIDGVLERTAEAFPGLLAQQQEIQEFQQENSALLARADTALAERRQRLGRRTAAPLVSPAAYAGLGRSVSEAVLNAGSTLRSLDVSFFEARWWVLPLHLLVAVLLAFLARRVRRRMAEEGEWRDLLRHPWAVGWFLSTPLVATLYRDAPPLWNLALWVLVAVSGSLLAGGLFGDRRRRSAVYALAFFYPAFFALEVMDFPVPLFRLLLAGSALLGVPALLLVARASERTGDARGFALVLRLGAAALGLVLLAEVLGFDVLSHWLIESASTSAFLVFVAVFLLRLGRGGLHAFLATRPPGRLALLRRVGYELARRLTWLLQLVVGGWAALWLLAIWGVFSSPLQAWQEVVGFRVSAGTFTVSLGQLLLGAVAIYLSFLLSWLLRAFLDREVFERRELDRGVGDSVKTLLHYSLIVVGTLLGLSLAGFELRSLAIVAGALGVGIGFGLQNVVNNFVSGLILLFERPVRAGDTVVVAGEWGVIRKIGLRSTVVTTYDQAEVIVPNSSLISETVTNWTLSNKSARIVVPVGVAYGSDVEAVIRELLAAAGEQQRILTEPPPQCLFTGFGDSSLDFELRLWVREVEDRLTVRSETLRAIDRRFREAGIEIPFPQRDLHLRSVDPGAVLPVAREGEPPSAAGRSTEGRGESAAGEPP